MGPTTSRGALCGDSVMQRFCLCPDATFIKLEQIKQADGGTWSVRFSLRCVSRKTVLATGCLIWYNEFEVLSSLAG